MTSKQSLLRTALLTLASGIAGLASATAAVVAEPANGDIFLGFRASGGDGSATSYLINLGQDAVFRNAVPGTTITLSLGSIGTDLANTYGTTWYDRDDLYWGVFGVRDSSSPAVYGSQEQITAGSPTTPWPALSLTARNSVTSQINSVLTQTGGYRGSQATLNSTVAVLQPNSGAASSYNFQVANGGTDFGSLSQWGSIEGNFADGTEGTVLDFYRISGSATPVQLLGQFTINDSGTITFTAVPEPSAALLGGLGTLVLLNRRRRPATV